MFLELKYVIDNYVDWHDETAADAVAEPPYWNNEAASVSMLIGAAARRNYIGLADYRTQKVRKRQKVNGRCDLYIARRNRWLEVEAKQIFVEPDAQPAKVDAAMERAMLDARCLPTKEPCAALVFAILSLPAEDQTDSWKPTDYLKLFKQVDYDFGWIWYDTQVDERYRWEGGKRVYPGVAVLLKHRRNK